MVKILSSEGLRKFLLGAGVAIVAAAIFMLQPTVKEINGVKSVEKITSSKTSGSESGQLSKLEYAEKQEVSEAESGSSTPDWLARREGILRAITIPIPAGTTARKEFDRYIKNAAQDIASAKKASRIWHFCRVSNFNSTTTELSYEGHPTRTGCDEINTEERTVFVDLIEQIAILGGENEALDAARVPPNVTPYPKNENDKWFARNVARLERFAMTRSIPAMLQLSELYRGSYIGSPDPLKRDYWLSEAIKNMPIGANRARFEALLLSISL